MPSAGGGAGRARPACLQLGSRLLLALQPLLLLLKLLCEQVLLLLLCWDVSNAVLRLLLDSCAGLCEELGICRKHLKGCAQAALQLL